MARLLFCVLASFWLVSTALANRQAARIFQRADEVKARFLKRKAEGATGREPPTIRTSSKTTSRYLNGNTQKFWVDGTAIPEVDFDIGESYAGLLPISDDPYETRQLYFWFFPSTTPDPKDEIVIWFNGGPGCSSLSGLLTENGPFLWQQGTYKPVPNSYSWTNLTNVLFVEQPVGVGFSQGQPNITNEVQLGQQFIGFYKQFVDAFQTYGNKVYLAGESYAGIYIPYVADAFISANDTNYYNLAGLSINDPILGNDIISEQVIVLPFVNYWSNIFYFNSSFMEDIQHRSDQCNYTSYFEKYFTFPPVKESFPVLNVDESCDLFTTVYEAALEVNPCFNIYHITDTCPSTISWLGIVNQGDYSPPSLQVYFNRTDVQAAINAPVGTNWMQCWDGNVFNYGYKNNDTLEDTSVSPAQSGVLQRVIEYTNNTLIGGGNLDFILPPNGTLLALQNTTWNGMKGFQEYPQQHELYVPYHPEYNAGRRSEAGFVGKWGEERGLVFYTVQLSGHELPGYSAGTGYRILEKLLGRISSLSEVSDFTTQHGGWNEKETGGKLLGYGSQEVQQPLGSETGYENGDL